MNIEDVTKAAGEYRLATAQSMGVYGQYHYIDECSNHGLSCDELVEDSFIKGAEWRINSVWHDAKECPERKRNYLAQCKNGRFNVIPDSMNWDNFYKKAEIIRWAYIEDLLP